MSGADIALAHEPKSRPQHSAYADDSQSPVPSLTNGTSRASSASSSVNSMSPDTLVTTPRDLLPRFNKAVASTSPAAIGDVSRKRQREYGDEVTETDDSELRHSSRKRRMQSAPLSPQLASAAAPPLQVRAARPKKRLTGSADFVSMFGLNGLYEQFVRPYAPGPAAAAAATAARRPLPDLTAAYLCDIKGAAEQQQSPESSLDLMGLVMAPPKNDLDRLDPLPTASIRAAFRIGDRRHHRRSRVSLKMSDAPKQRGYRKQEEHGRRPQQPQQQQQASPPKAY